MGGTELAQRAGQEFPFPPAEWTPADGQVLQQRVLDGLMDYRAISTATW
jgi:hypothetical protein